MRSLEGVRALTAADAESVGHLMYDAYLGTVDYTGESLEDAVNETRRTFEGSYGPMLWDASLGLLVNDQVQSAVVVTLFEDEPLHAFCITRPQYQRQGFCRELMKHSLRALNQAGYQTAHLYVTATNVPALGLYRQLHFNEVAQ